MRLGDRLGQETIALGELFQAGAMERSPTSDFVSLIKNPDCAVYQQRFIVAGASVWPVKLRQPFSSLEELCDLQKSGKKDFEAMARTIARQIGGRLDIAPVKTMHRMKEKAGTDYNGDISRIIDPLRCSIYIKSIEQYHRAERFLSPDTNSDILRYENAFARPDESGGQRRVKANPRISNGLITEFQVRHEGMEKAYGETADLYKRIRHIEARMMQNPNMDNAQALALGQKHAGLIAERVSIHNAAAAACGMDRVVLQRDLMLVDDMPVVKNYDPSTGEFSTLIPDAQTGRFRRDNSYLYKLDNPGRVQKNIPREAFLARCMAMVPNPEKLTHQKRELVARF